MRNWFVTWKNRLIQVLVICLPILNWFVTWKNRLIQVLVICLLILSGLIQTTSSQVDFFLKSVADDLGTSQRVPEITFLYSWPLRVVFMLRVILSKVFSLGRKVSLPCERMAGRLDNKLLYIRNNN
jgi:hypothetical protein